MADVTKCTNLLSSFCLFVFKNPTRLLRETKGKRSLKRQALCKIGGINKYPKGRR